MEPKSKQQIAMDRARAKASESERSRRFMNAHKALSQHWNEHVAKYGDAVEKWPEPVRNKFQADERGLQATFIKPEEADDFEYFTESTDLDAQPMQMTPPRSAQAMPAQQSSGWHDPVQQPEFLRAMSKATGLPETYWKRGK